MALARLFSGGVAIRYVFPVLWMTSYNGSVAHCVYSEAAIENCKHNSRDSNRILLNDKDQKYSLLRDDEDVERGGEWGDGCRKLPQR